MLVVAGFATTACGQSQELSAAFERGEAFRAKGQFREAIPHLETAMRLAIQAYGENGKDTSTIQLGLANAYRDAARYREAEGLYQRSLRTREAQYGPNTLKSAEVINSLANLYVMTARYKEAQPLYQRSLNIFEGVQGANHLDVGLTVSNLAIVAEKLGNYGESEKLFLRALRIKESQPKRNELSIANTQYSLASLYAAQDRHAEAESYFKKSLVTRQAQLGADHPDVALNLNELGRLAYIQARYQEAEPYLQRSLQIREAKLGPNHPTVAMSLNALASLAVKLGQYERVEPLLLRNIRINEAVYGANHVGAAASWLTLANFYRISGSMEKSEPLFGRALPVLETHYGADHPNVAAPLSHRGLLYLQLDRPQLADADFQRALRILERQHGQQHSSVASMLHYLGIAAWARGENPQAIDYFTRSMKIAEGVLGPEHPEVIRSLQYQAMTAAAQGDWNEAARTVDRSRRIVRRHVAKVLPALSESEQLTYLQHIDVDHFHKALTVAWHRKDDSAAVAQSAAWVLNGKAITQQVLVEQAYQARDRKDAASGGLSDQLTAVRKQLASLMLDPDQPGSASDRRQRTEQLRQQEANLARQLAQVTGRPQADDPWIDTGALRAALANDSVYVDVFRVELRGFRGGENDPGPHYLAWIIPPANQGTPELIDLGEAAAIDAAVKTLRQELAASGKAIQDQGEQAAEKALRPALEALSKLVLEPMKAKLAAKSQWIVSPDGALWLVPWEALAWDEGYVTEKHRVSYVVSGRDLVLPAPKHPKTNSPMMMANPDFDLGIAQTKAATQKLLTEVQSRNLLRTPTRSLQLGAVQRLPGTAREAEAVKPNLQRYTGVAPILYSDQYALEGIFKVFARPQVAVISTHGFFLEDQQSVPAGNSTLIDPLQARDRAGQPLENPLLRCGLLLAGVNHRAQSSDPTVDDGVLTGLEIVSTDLRGTKLVVLSACETGLGDIRNGEGVAGLRQAFQLAGAQTVASTLWQIPDVESARLISDFFENLANGQVPGDALRNSQIKQIESRRGRFGAAHPFFWAAYTLTGKPGV